MGDKTKIDWCDSSWNPVTGCNHGCEYCYARGIARRHAAFETGKKDYFGFSTLRGKDCEDGGCHDLDRQLTHLSYTGDEKKSAYPYGFDPTFHRYRLGIPARWKNPRNIFVCSMADLFGDWVPDEWIEEVFRACEAAPQHRYLFLTKNPQRYNDLMADGKLPERDNFWYGGTRTGIDTDREHEAAMTANTFLSVEPLLAPMERETLNAIEFFGWVIVGAETGNRKDKIAPRREWVEEIADACMKAQVPIFMKNSLREVMGDHFLRQYPWPVTNKKMVEGLTRDEGIQFAVESGGLCGICHDAIEWHCAPDEPICEGRYCEEAYEIWLDKEAD